MVEKRIQMNGIDIGSCLLEKKTIMKSNRILKEVLFSKKKYCAFRSKVNKGIHTLKKLVIFVYGSLEAMYLFKIFLMMNLFCLLSDWWSDLPADQLLVWAPPPVLLLPFHGVPRRDQGQFRSYYDLRAGWGHGYRTLYRTHAQPDPTAASAPGRQIWVYGHEGHCSFILRWG